MSDDSEGLDEFAHFDTEAEAMLKQWAMLRKRYARSQEQLHTCAGDLTSAHARIEELMRANTQLEGQLRESQTREGLALKKVGYLEGLIQSAGNSLSEAARKVIENTGSQAGK